MSAQVFKGPENRQTWRMEHANRSDKWVLWVKVFLGGGEEWVKDIKVGVCYNYGEVQES